MAEPLHFDRETDVVVLGSGAAGLSAALRARASGARVLIAEKAPVLGGTTAMSGSCTWVPQHHHMAEVGATDSREEALTYIRAVAPEGWHNAEEPLWVAFVDHAPDMLKFLEANSPLRFKVNLESDPYAEAPGGKRFGRNVTPRPLSPAMLGPWRDKVRQSSRPQLLNYEEIIHNRLYSDPMGGALRFGPAMLWRRLRGQRTQGGALVIGLLKGCLDKGCEILVDAPAERLLTDAGRVVGVVLRHAGKAVAVRARRGVVLATGGFDWNPEMMARYRPGPSEWTASPRTNTGDGQRMAEAVGARLDRMDQALVMGSNPTTYDGQEQGKPAADYTLPHSMIVDRTGRRFVNEAQMNIGLAFEKRDPATGWPVHQPAWRIYDANYARKYWHALPRGGFARYLHTAPTLRALAAEIGVDADGLEETAVRMTRFAAAGRDDDFGRGSHVWDLTHSGDPRHKPNPQLGAIDKPPFHAVPFHASYLATKGGARTNERGQVLRPDGTRIEALYAAGNAMANPFGSKAVGAGTTLGPCLTWGYVCGLNVVQETPLA